MTQPGLSGRHRRRAVAVDDCVDQYVYMNPREDAATTVESTTMRVDLSTRRLIGELAEEERASMQEIIARAVDLYRRERLFERMASSLATMTPDERAAERAEASAWDATLADGGDE
jgi:nucleoside-diphosphate-sugar epimerase